MNGEIEIGAAGGPAAWLLARFGRTPKPAPRLRLMERIALGPRQTLSLVEAEGRRVLVATSPEGAPAFYEIDRACERAAARVSQRVSQRVSW